jgi:hypothetical protein
VIIAASGCANAGPSGCRTGQAAVDGGSPDTRELIHAALRDSGGDSGLNSCITIAGDDDPLAQHLLGPSVVM